MIKHRCSQISAPSDVVTEFQVKGNRLKLLQLAAYFLIAATYPDVETVRLRLPASKMGLN